jgi:hypothetical protein
MYIKSVIQIVIDILNLVPKCQVSWYSGADPGFQVRGAHLKKLRRAEGGAKMFGVFRVKNHDFTPKNLIFSNCGGRYEIVGVGFLWVLRFPPSIKLTITI